MDITYLDEGDVYMVEPGSEEERRFIESCPQDWTWGRVLGEWEMKCTDLEDA